MRVLFYITFTMVLESLHEVEYHVCSSYTGVHSPPLCVLCACRPLDVFFVLLLGPYCLVSSTSHSTQHHHWGWHLKLPVAQPDDVLTLVSLCGKKGRVEFGGGQSRVLSLLKPLLLQLLLFAANTQCHQYFSPSSTFMLCLFSPCRRCWLVRTRLGGASEWVRPS